MDAATLVAARAAVDGGRLARCNRFLRERCCELRMEIEEARVRESQLMARLHAVENTRGAARLIVWRVNKCVD